MLDDTPTGSETQSTAGPEGAPAKKAAAKRAKAKTAAKKAPAKTAAKKATAPRRTAAKKTAEQAETPALDGPAADPAPAKKAATKKATAKAASAKKAQAKKTAPSADAPVAGSPTPAGSAVAVPLFQAPDTAAAPARKSRKKAATPASDTEADSADVAPDTAPKVTTRTRTRSGSKPKPEVADAPQDPPTPGPDDSEDQDDGDESGDGARRRRRRGGRRRRKSGGEGDDAQDSGQDGSNQGGQRGQRGQGQAKAGTNDDTDTDIDDGDGDSSSPSSRRRRRRRRSGEDGGDGGDDPQNTVTRVRKTRSAEDQITAVSGSTRLEAKKQRRREGREAGRRRAPIVSEAEFLARRESVERVMAIRQRDDLTQIAVIEDKVLVEHYVARESQTSLIGNIYLGRVQNVLPSMEAAFIDIGKGRNAVLYAGEVNWSALGHKDGQPRKIESVLSSGQSVLVQATKDPVGNKGARLSSQISLAGRFLVYVPDGTNSGISRKLPDTERSRLKALLKEIVPDTAGVIVRTAAEGASEEELTSDVERLKARWEDIEKKSANKGAGAQLLYGEPDLMLKVVRDLFTEDFAKLVVQGDDAWDIVQGYVTHVAPDLEERLEKYDPSGADLFTAYRIDEQIQKGLDRKVWLPSGGSLIIDRTEAMTVVDVNTGKFTGSGGNLEETVTKNNLEAAEEMVRQLRLRDIGGIIVIDFIDMVLESNRDLVLRRLVECLGRDRTRHQVAEVTSLGLVQMTRKRIGTGLVESFSENCEHCNGRGVVISDLPVEPKRDQESQRGSRRRSGRGRSDDGQQDGQNTNSHGNGKSPSPKDVAAMARTPKSEEFDEAAEPTAAIENAEAIEPEAEQSTEIQPERPVEKPVVKTTSRRSRSPRRPADEPVDKPADEPADEPAEQPAPVEQPAADIEPEPEPTPVENEPEPEPEPTPVENEPTPAPATEPVAPRVVTRTRRRSASRPAGPPATSGVPVAAEPADTEIGNRSVVEHVPVKKRGSRKR